MSCTRCFPVVNFSDLVRIEMTSSFLRARILLSYTHYIIFFEKCQYYGLGLVKSTLQLINLVIIENTSDNKVLVFKEIRVRGASANKWVC